MLEKNSTKLELRTVFIYVTEKCNLKCTYCYFRHKKRRDISFKRLEAFFDGVMHSAIVPKAFEISGGEPFLCWDSVKVIVREIEKRFPGRRIGIQTNGILLTPDKVAWLKAHGVALEFGIDGNLSVTSRWRKKMGSAGYARLLSNIQLCLKQGVSVGCNMTVHPAETGRMIEGFKFLKSMGVRSVDVTPAAFMPWGETDIAIFKEQYSGLLREAKKNSGIYTRGDTEFFHYFPMDLSFHPPGYVLCGDIYLCLSDALKAQYSIWDYKNNTFRVEAFKFFIQSYKELMTKFCHGDSTHRDYICSGFEIISRIAGKKYLNTDAMIALMRFLKRAHWANS